MNKQIEDVEYEEIYDSAIDRFKNTWKITYIDIGFFFIKNLVFTIIYISNTEILPFNIIAFFITRICVMLFIDYIILFVVYKTLLILNIKPSFKIFFYIGVVVELTYKNI